MLRVPKRAWHHDALIMPRATFAGTDRVYVWYRVHLSEFEHDQVETRHISQQASHPNAQAMRQPVLHESIESVYLVKDVVHSI